jgi:hypothetical protein
MKVVWESALRKASSQRERTMRASCVVDDEENALTESAVHLKDRRGWLRRIHGTGASSRCFFGTRTWIGVFLRETAPGFGMDSIVQQVITIQFAHVLENRSLVCAWTKQPARSLERMDVPNPSSRHSENESRRHQAVQCPGPVYTLAYPHGRARAIDTKHRHCCFGGCHDEARRPSCVAWPTLRWPHDQDQCRPVRVPCGANRTACRESWRQRAT